MKKNYCFLLSLLGILVLSSPSWATDRYVAPTGNDTNSGSIDSPMLTIQAAINAASAGDVIKVQPGTYKETVIVNKQLTITGAGKGSNPAANTVLTPASACTGVGFTISAANVTVQNMYVANYEVAVLLNGAASPTLQEMALIDYCQHGINLTGTNSNVTITKTDIQRTSLMASTIGIRVVTTNAVNGMLIDNCTISGNTQGMLVTQSTTPVAFDNIIIQNSNISNNTQKGLYFEKLSNALLSNLTMNNNGTDSAYDLNNGIDINLKYGNYANITIQNSDITNSGVNGTASDAQSATAIAIKARDDSPSYNANPATLTGVLLKNNRITGPQNGIRFGEFGKTNATPTNVTLEQNDLSFGFVNKALISRTNGTVVLNCNWHGSTNVSTITGGFISAGSGVINLNQLLSSGTDGDPAVGFQPDAGSCLTTPLSGGVLSGGAVICAGLSTDIKVVITGGIAPYTVVYSNGNTNTTVNNYTSGNKISVSPALTTTYALVSVTDANGSALVPANLSGSALVTVKSFDLTLINIGQSRSAIKINDKAAWANQFITPDAGSVLDLSTQTNPTIFYSENTNKTAPRYWTVNAEACALGTNGSLTFDMLATPELGVVRSYNTHENNAPYFMFANREGFTELYAQNHPAYGFYQDNDNGNGVNIHDEGFPKGLYKLSIRYWDQKGQGSIYPSTRQPAGNVLAYEEYWFRIQSKDGIGTGAARIASENGQRRTDNGAFAQVMPNPVSNVLRLKVLDSKAQKVNVSLLDASGRMLFQRGFVPETNAHQEEFEVSELANGMYFLQVNAGEKQATLKVVKVQ